MVFFGDTPLSGDDSRGRVLARAANIHFDASPSSKDNDRLCPALTSDRTGGDAQIIPTRANEKDEYRFRPVYGISRFRADIAILGSMEIFLEGVAVGLLSGVN